MKLSAQLLLVAACLLLTAFSTGEESTQEVLITPFAVVDPDEVVAEAAVAEEALVQIKTAIPIPDHMPLSDALQNSPYNNPGAMSAGVYQYDDNDDREARQNPAGWVNSQGLNKMTGQAPVAYDGKIIVDGMSEADHITSTPTMGRDYVTKGYTTEDAKTSSDGHYYIGSGRRRIGAGFGRRRAAVEIPITSEEQKAESDKMMKELFSDPTKSAVFDDFAHMLRSSYQQDKGTEAMKPMTEEEKAKVVAELYGLTHGPQFFEKQNYKGKHIMVQKSISNVKETGVLENKMISSMKIPAGWCATLFAGKEYQGEKLNVCGPVDQWSLKKYPLTLESRQEMSTTGDKEAIFRTEAATKYHTTWDNQVNSIMLTQNQYILVQPTQKCVKSCGMNKHEYIGEVKCLQTHHLESRRDVDQSACQKVGLTKPMVPIHRCDDTRLCTIWNTSPVPAEPACTITCGFIGDTKYGKVWCEDRERTGGYGSGAGSGGPVETGGGYGSGAGSGGPVETGGGYGSGAGSGAVFTSLEPEETKTDEMNSPESLLQSLADETGGGYGSGAGSGAVIDPPGSVPVPDQPDSPIPQGAVAVDGGSLIKSVVPGKHVDNTKCDAWGLQKPVKPSKECPATPPCVQWKTSPASPSCTTTCGYSGTTNYGTSFCQEVDSGSTVSDGKCTFTGYGSSNLGSKPAVPQVVCPATPPCVQWKTSPASTSCTTTCGYRGTTNYGTSFCQEVDSGSTVSDGQCTFTGYGSSNLGGKPAAPQVVCPPTPLCVQWMSVQPGGCPSCNYGGGYQYGYNYCRETVSGTSVAATKCTDQGHQQPGTPTSYCGATSACRGTCCLWLKGYSNSCMGNGGICSGGNSHYKYHCSTSRACD